MTVKRQRKMASLKLWLLNSEALTPNPDVYTAESPDLLQSNSIVAALEI